MSYNYQDAPMESQQEYFGKVHPNTYKGTLTNALKRIEQLEAQIEKMKCCRNCSHYKLDKSGLYPIYVCELTYPNRCKNHDKWEIEEND